MKISNFKKSEKVLYTVINIFVICGFASVISGLVSEGFDFWAFMSLLIIGVAFVVFAVIDMLALSSETILCENGIAFKTIFRKRFYSWNEIKFIASYDITYQYNSPTGIICSLDLEKDEIKFRHFDNSIFAKRHFCFPYSEETVNYIISNSPDGKYIGLAFTDETFKK